MFLNYFKKFFKKKLCAKIERDDYLKVSRSLPYVPIGRNLLYAHKTRKDAMGAFYIKEVASACHIIPRRGAVPERRTEAERVAVPVFEIAANNEVRYMEKIPAREIKARALDALKKCEDTEVLKDINAAVRSSQTITHSIDLDPVLLSMAFKMIENHNLEVRNIVVHPNEAAEIRLFDKHYFKLNSKRKFRKTACIGKFLDANVYVTHRMIPGDILLTAPKEFVGFIPIKDDARIRLDDEPSKLSKNYVAYESIGIVVINDYAIAKLQRAPISVPVPSVPEKKEEKPPIVVEKDESGDPSDIDGFVTKLYKDYSEIPEEEKNHGVH